MDIRRFSELVWSKRNLGIDEQHFALQHLSIEQINITCEHTVSVYDIKESATNESVCRVIVPLEDQTYFREFLNAVCKSKALVPTS